MAALTLRIVASTAVTKTATGGTSGTATITVSDVFGIVIGHLVEGTGIGNNAVVSSIAPDTNTITLSVNNTGNVTGSIAFKEFTKNSPLTNQQVDDNFVELRRDLVAKAPLSYATMTNLTVSSGTINSTSIGATTRSTGAFTTLTSNGATTFTDNTASTSVSTGAVVVTGGLGVGGRVTADNFVGTGTGLTSLTAGNLSGTIPSGVLANSSVFIGTTSVALNRATANLALTGISSVAFPGATSGTATLQAAATAGTPTLTLPTATGNLVGTGDTGTVTNAMLAGSIANAKLTNSSITINGSAVSLGGSVTVSATATAALTIGNGLSGSSYNGSSAVTIAVSASNNTTNASYFPVFATSQGTAVALGTHSTLNYNPGTGVLGATDFNTTSDARLKMNVQSIEGNGLAMLSAVRPVSFTWIETNRKSHGVIAQEIERILPELIEEREDGIKGVSYIPLIAMLIDAVQTLEQRINQLAK